MSTSTIESRVEELEKCLSEVNILLEEVLTEIKKNRALSEAIIAYMEQGENNEN